MRKYLFMAAAAVLALAAVPAPAQNSRIVEDGGTGPYKAIMMEESTLNTHTIFRPQDLSKFGEGNLLPVLVWGNGGCANSPSGHVNFLNEVASQGFLIVAIGPSNYQQIEGPRPGQTGDMPRPQMGGGMGQGGFHERHVPLSADRSVRHHRGRDRYPGKLRRGDGHFRAQTVDAALQQAV